MMASPPTIQGIQSSTGSALPPDLNPAHLDTIPVLTSILLRLQTSPPTSDIHNSISSPPTSQPLTQSLSQSTHQNPTSSPAQLLTSQSITSNVSLSQTQDKEKYALFSTTPLATKEIPAATDALKNRLQKARLAARELPDIKRGVEEQDKEIEELEARIREQKAVLERLRQMGALYGEGTVS